MAEKQGFTSSFGAIAAAVGSAVGLGNIWRFPYICGQYGGGAFLLVYLIFVFLIGMLLMLSEFIIGRRSQHSPIFAYESLSPHKAWRYAGLLGLITCFLILGLYLVISGWTTNYVFDSITGHLAGLSPDQLDSHFASFSSSALRPIIFIAIFLALTALVIIGGVQKGIEKVSKILMPVLVVLLAILCVRSVTLPGASAGLEYLFRPDFSKLTGEGILAALGQALFSLSVGMGVMIVYGSYIPNNDNLLKTSLWITVCDTLIAILAGIAIFPAVFACGQDPAGGPGLVFKILPAVFNSMNPESGLPFGTIFASLFFILLTIAALTSSISLLEAQVAWGSEYHPKHRTRHTLILSAIVLAIAAFCSLSNGVLSHLKVAGSTIFDLIDHINSIYLPPLCALLTVLFTGWVMPKSDIRDELSNHGSLRISYFGIYYFIIRYIAPLALLVVLVTGIINSLH
ncbi:MAG: sodium-dependent transporter [Bacteroidales bacterium]|nr:sodium-dependent transporter [Bacteroidales bacterium]